MLEEILAGGAAALGISLPENAPRLYRAYYTALTEANRQFNLTAIEGEGQAATLHFLDSLAVLRWEKLAGKTVIDVGTGGGIPGLALKIAEPALQLTLLDATEKKTAFLASLSEKLGLPCVCLTGRAEELGHESAWRQTYDIAVARAVAETRILAEICLPFVKVGGKLLALKSADTDGELKAAESTVKALGGVIAAIHDYTLPGTDIPRRIAVIEKTAPTPEKYPRRWAAIQKRPL